MNRIARWRVWLGSLILGRPRGWTGYRPRRIVVIPADAPWWKRSWYRVRPPSTPKVSPMRTPPIQRLMSPPDDELGAVVPVQRLLAAGDEYVVVLASCVAFTTGFQLSVWVRKRHELPPAPDPRVRYEPAERSLDIGVRFADGRKSNRATGYEAVRAYFEAFAAGEDPPVPSGPVFGSGGGGGGGRSWEWTSWVWPLPPDGPMTVTCHWPAGGVPDGSTQLDGSTIRRAGESSRRLWTD
jgi:hypothetical protein